jgi:stage II sporulation protein P
MKKFRVRIRLKIYQVILISIIITSIYLLIRFVTISFSDDIGQAGILNTAISYISKNIIVKGPSLISYTANENEQTVFIGNLIGDRLALGNFLADDAVETYAWSNPQLILNNNYTNNTDIAETDTDAPSGISFNDEAGKYLGLEYILTNGAVIKSEASGRLLWDGDISEDQLNIGYLKGELSPAPEDAYGDEAAQAAAITNGRGVDFTLDQLRDVNFLIKNFYKVDGTTAITDSLFDGDKLVTSDMTLQQSNDKPQILIFHTHSEEDFIDSRPGVEDDTVVGMGTLLAKTLREQYDYNVIHDKTYYDVLKGYNMSYSQAEAGLTKKLNENPSIEVVIDVHRNSGKEKIVSINGKETAQIEMFNGLCRDHDGPMTDLVNPYLQDNLAFSLQLQLKSLAMYPGLFNKNYLKAYRYNMHFRPKSLLVELGTEYNTVGQAKNAIVLFAQVLDAVLKGNGNEADIADIANGN